MSKSSLRSCEECPKIRWSRQQRGIGHLTSGIPDRDDDDAVVVVAAVAVVVDADVMPEDADCCVGDVVDGNSPGCAVIVKTLLLGVFNLENPVFLLSTDILDIVSILFYYNDDNNNDILLIIIMVIVIEVKLELEGGENMKWIMVEIMMVVIVVMVVVVMIMMMMMIMMIMEMVAMKLFLCLQF